jgi:hypothetical protein
MKNNIYISYINNESINFKIKMMDRFKGRKYKHSDETYTLQTDVSQDSDELLKLAKNVSRTDVTVVFITRSILESSWIPFEVEYSLDVYGKAHENSAPNGVIGVVIPDKGNDYSYIMKKGAKGIWQTDKSKLPSIISANMHNERIIQNKNNINYDSFISVYRWEDFIRDFNNCIEVAFDKAKNHFEDYKITTK